MKVPLIVKSVVDDDKQFLDIWRDGKKERIKPPFLPYVICKTPLTFQNVTPASEEHIVGRPLSTLISKPLIKYSFPNTKHISNLNKALESSTYAMGDDRIPKLVCENHTEFRERILIDQPDFFFNYPNNNDLKFFFFDLETATKNGIDQKKVISAAWATNDRTVYSNQSTNEKELLQWLFKAIEEVNPDIFVGYNHIWFDFPYFFDRCIQNGINYTKLGRDGFVDYYKKGSTAKVDIGGRAQFDVFNAVWEDQTLYGIKNRRMKTVAKHFGIPVIEEDTTNTIDIPIDKLKLYNESDVTILMSLFDAYFGNYLYTSEMDGIPLNMMLSSSNSFQASIFQGVGLHAKGIISDGTNSSRHPEIYNRSKSSDDPNYQGAIVEIYKKGFIKNTSKVDVKGMYNAIQIMLNASPETTKLLGYRPYQSEFSYTQKGTTIIYQIPDKVLNKTVIIGIDHKEDGVLRTKLREIRKKRAEIKQLMKTAPEHLQKMYESQQWGLKVKANIPYGYNGSSIARWGDVAVAIITTAVGRIVVQEIIDYINENYSIDDQSPCIETDTDGVYTSTLIDIDKLNAHIAEFATKIFGVPNEIILEPEVFKEGYFIGMKNYILYDEKDNLIIHGNSLKSSSMPGCFDSALQSIADCVLQRSDKSIKEVINQILDVTNYELDDLILSKTLHKPPSEYSKKSFLAKMIEQANILGIPVEEGTQLEYIKCLDSYQLISTVKSKHEVDITYYQDLISKLVINFGFDSQLKTRSIQDAEEWA